MRSNAALNIPAIALVFFAANASIQAAADPNTTRAKIEKYGKDLVEAWEKFPGEAQKSTRTQTIQDINTTFTRELNRAETSKTKMAKAYTAFLNDLEKTTDLFKVDKMKTERNSYVKACTTVFKREILFSSDYAAERTTQKCFDLLMDMLEEARDRFIQEKDKDLRSEATSAVNQYIQTLFSTAKIPDGVDHASMMDKNIKDAKARFPVSTEAMKLKNGPLFNMCESAAKNMKQRAAAAAK